MAMEKEHHYTGGIAPHSRAVARRLSRRASGANAIDRTAYCLSRSSTRSHYTHHTQRISANVIKFDAQNIREQAGHVVRRALLLMSAASPA